MAKIKTTKFYTISYTDDDYILTITKKSCYNEDGDKVNIILESNGIICVTGLEAGSEEMTLEEFFDYVEADNLTFDEPLYLGNEEVNRITNKSGEVTAIKIGSETIDKDEVLELMKQLNWI